MAKTIDATSYTIESKNNFLSFVIPAVTFGLVGYKNIKVIKR
jgi:hypothetical protein